MKSLNQNELKALNDKRIDEAIAYLSALPPNIRMSIHIALNEEFKREFQNDSSHAKTIIKLVQRGNLNYNWNK